MKTLFVNPIGEHDLLGCPPSAFFTEAHITARNVGRIPGCSVDFIDFVDTTPQQMIQRVTEEKYDLIGLVAAALNRFMVISLAREIKKASPETKIFVFGNFFGLFPEETLTRIPEVDYVASGDSTPVAVELIQALKNDGTLETITGLSYRNGDSMIVGQKRKPAKLDEVIYTDNEFFKPTYSIDRPMPLWEEDESKLCYPIMTSVSCSNNCSYCHLQTVPYRNLSVEKTIENIEKLVTEQNKKNFLLVDASLACNEKRLQEICRGIISRKLDIQWACEIAPTVVPETLELMAKAGCVSIHFALETGSKRVQEIMRPRSTLSQTKEVGRKCAELGIRFAYFSLVSFPTEEMSDVWETVEALRELAKEGGFSGMAPVFIMPKTKLEEIAIERGLISKDFDWFDDSYRCELGFVTPGSGEQTMPHSIECMTETQIQYLLGFVLAVQDFAAANPRVANLRYGFLYRLSYLHFGFMKSFLDKQDYFKAAQVFGECLKMHGQFWYWKAAKMLSLISKDR